MSMLKVNHSYFLCVKPRGNKLNLIMEGKGNSTRITVDCIDDCTAAVVSGDAEKVRNEAAAIGENGDNTTHEVEVYRKFCRFKENSTKIEITIRLNFRFCSYLE